MEKEQFAHCFNLHIFNMEWFISDGVETRLLKTMFTEKEFAELEEKFDIKGMFVKEKLNDK